MRRKLILILAAFMVIVCASAAGLTAYASYEAGRSRALPYPNVARASDPAAIARGAAIFHASCESCHRGKGAARATGARMSDAPDWIGRLYSGNLTAHPRAGIGALSDASLGRTIRQGVDREGRWIPMPSYAFSDADLAAVLGFLRSNDPLLAPDERRPPRSELTLAGKLALLLGGALATAEAPNAQPFSPPRAPSADYGRYLAESVYQCGDCHTPGFERDKLKGPEAYTGGAEMKDEHGRLILTPNLTPDRRTGIGAWTRAEFARAVREGVRPDGRLLHAPMPRFSGADELEIDALLSYLRSFPARQHEIPRPRATDGAAAKAAL